MKRLIRCNLERLVLNRLTLEKVLEIVRPGLVTRIPGAPPAVLGAANLRGKVIAVIDLGFCLKNTRTTRKDSGRFLVINYDDEPAALYVDRVFNIEEYTLSRLLSVPEEVQSPGRGTAGAIEKDGNFVILLDTSEIIKNFVLGRGHENAGS